MKKQIKLNSLFISMLVLGCSLGFVACSDDDEQLRHLLSK